MFKSLCERVARDADFPLRTFRLEMLGRVLDGSIYDHLPYDFHTEKNAAEEYIPLRERRPSVRYALCRAVVDDAVGLLFSEGHFPGLVCADEPTRDALARLIRDAKLNAVMIEAATLGSVGSVAIRLRVLGNRVFFDALPTGFMTPAWRAEAPDTLLEIVEQYKVRGAALRAAGYEVAEADLARDFWFRRCWDAEAEHWFLPWPVGVEAEPVRDAARSVVHGLGFVPLVWVKNLPGGVGVDGACTFEAAINASIEMDYLLSQSGRGLKYSADPTLLIKEPAVDAAGRLVKGAGNAITVGRDGDAKLLEINGSAAEAVIAYVRCLRELALESVHGNRANADRLSAAPSGRAMELMNQALILLADKLRISYGEGALLELLQMVLRASRKFPLVDRRGRALGPLEAEAELGLRWPAWYAPTAADKAQVAATLAQLVGAGLLSRESAVAVLAGDYALDAADELVRLGAGSQAAVLLHG